MEPAELCDGREMAAFIEGGVGGHAVLMREAEVGKQFGVIHRDRVRMIAVSRSSCDSVQHAVFLHLPDDVPDVRSHLPTGKADGVRDRPVGHSVCQELEDASLEVGQFGFGEVWRLSMPPSSRLPAFDPARQGAGRIFWGSTGETAFPDSLPESDWSCSCMAIGLRAQGHAVASVVVVPPAAAQRLGAVSEAAS